MAGLNLCWLIGLSFAPSQATLSGRSFGRIKKVMDASFLCLNPPVADLSRRQERQKKKERHGDLLTRPVKVEGRMNATRLSLTVRDVKGEL